MSFWWVTLDDESPLIGEGKRLVYVEKQTRSSVKLRSPVTLSVDVISVPQWELLAAKGKPAHPDPEPMAKRMRQMARRLKRPLMQNELQMIETAREEEEVRKTRRRA
jgi:hypothetical protein